jgi:hypothetical protein
MRRIGIVVLAAVAVIALSACGSSSVTGDTTTHEAATLPGTQVVYDRINSLKNCSTLQAEFDQADANHTRELDAGNSHMVEATTSYMEAADNRMREVGCYR